MIYTIVNDGYVNGRPTSIGNRKITIANRAEHVFTIANFTSETNPPYSDPEGDAMSYVKIIQLPPLGQLMLNGVVVQAGDLIQAGSISTGNFKYVSEDRDLGYTEAFQFDVADVGSQSISGLINGVMIFEIEDIQNLPPDVVGDMSITNPYQALYAFSVADFTTGTTPPYNDPEGDAPYALKILDLPLEGFLTHNGSQVTANQVILFSEISSGYLTYAPNLLLTTAHTVTFNFAVSDAGSQQFTT